MYGIIVLLFVSTSVAFIHGDCGTCKTNFISCLGETNFTKYGQNYNTNCNCSAELYNCEIISCNNTVELSAIQQICQNNLCGWCSSSNISSNYQMSWWEIAIICIGVICCLLVIAALIIINNMKKRESMSLKLYADL